MGGLAVVIHGYVRFTADLGLVLEPDPEARCRAVRALAALGYSPRVPLPIDAFADEAAMTHLAAEKGMRVFGLLSEAHRETHVDLLIEVPFDFEAAHAGARRERIAPDCVMTVLPRRELLAMKRAAGRRKDLDDLEVLEALGEPPEGPYV